MRPGVIRLTGYSSFLQPRDLETPRPGSSVGEVGGWSDKYLAAIGNAYYIIIDLVVLPVRRDGWPVPILAPFTSAYQISSAWHGSLRYFRMVLLVKYKRLPSSLRIEPAQFPGEFTIPRQILSIAQVFKIITVLYSRHLKINGLISNANGIYLSCS